MLILVEYTCKNCGASFDGFRGDVDRCKECGSDKIMETPAISPGYRWRHNDLGLEKL